MINGVTNCEKDRFDFARPWVRRANRQRPTTGRGGVREYHTAGLQRL